MKVLCAYATRKSKPRVKSGLRKQQCTVTFWLQSFDTRNSSLANAKIHVTVQVFALLDFQFEGNSKYRPRRLIFERRFNRGFFSVTSLGAYTWRDLFLEFYGIYHDEFFILIIYVRVISCTYIFITMANPFPHSSPGEGRVGVATALNPLPFRLVISRS